MEKTALNFLRSKNMISPDHTEFIIKGSFGTICLNELLNKYVKYKKKAIRPLKPENITSRF